MALTIHITGQGTVAQQATAISRAYPDPRGAIANSQYTESGTAYTVTATPANGWRFGGFALVWTYIRDVSDDYGATWDDERTTQERATNATSPWASPLINSTWLDLYPRTNPVLFEGTVENIHDSSFGDPGMIHERFRLVNPVLLATFTRIPVADGPILRSDAGVILRADNGVIIRQG